MFGCRQRATLTREFSPSTIAIPLFLVFGVPMSAIQPMKLDEKTKDESTTPTPPVPAPAAPKKRKALSLDIKDLSEVIERKISPAA